MCSLGSVGKYDAAASLAAGLIRLARDKAGLTQSELANRAGISQQAVSAYETGRKEPTVATLQRLIGAAGLEMRIHLERVGDHDRSVDRVLESLSSTARAELEADQRRRVERARLDRIRGH
jgi:transcriptional regulator with XRE-family HTH domain